MMKVRFLFCWHVSALGCRTDSDEISQTIFIKALKFNMLLKEGSKILLSEFFDHLEELESEIKTVNMKLPS